MGGPWWIHFGRRRRTGRQRQAQNQTQQQDNGWCDSHHALHAVEALDLPPRTMRKRLLMLRRRAFPSGVRDGNRHATLRARMTQAKPPLYEASVERYEPAAEKFSSIHYGTGANLHSGHSPNRMNDHARLRGGIMIDEGISIFPKVAIRPKSSRRIAVLSYLRRFSPTSSGTQLAYIRSLEAARTPEVASTPLGMERESYESHRIFRARL